MPKNTRPFKAKCFFSYLKRRNFEYVVSDFADSEFSDFGALERVEFENKKFMGTIEIWSSGWIGLGLIILPEIEEILNLMLSPEKAEKEKIKFIIDEAMKKNESSSENR